MPKIRKDITTEKVCALLDKGLSTLDVATELDCSMFLVNSRAKEAGYDLTNRVTTKMKERKPQKRKMCSCCGVRPVPPVGTFEGAKLTRLCGKCFKAGCDDYLY